MSAGHEPPVEPGPSSYGPESARRRDAIATKKDGPLAWMAKNPVASNLLMLLLIVGGLLTVPRVRQEVFPEFELDLVLINVPYPGASPAEVEQGVILAVEEAVRGVDGVKEVRSTASESAGTVVIELLLGASPDRALADVKSAVDRITSFPKDVERPVVSLAQSRRQVISVMVSGDVSEKALRDVAERVRDDLLDSRAVTIVQLAGVRPLEVSVEVPRAELRRYGLTIDQVAQRVSAASVEVPGGGVKTPGGEILLRTAERRDRAQEFADVVVLSRPDGSEVRIGDLARVEDGFRETDQEAFFNGKRAAMVNVYRVGDEKPLEISALVKRYVEDHRSALPPGVDLSIWSDSSEIYADRVDLLRRNANFGLILVFAALALFLELRLAIWVTMGIPISVIGSMLLMPAWDASINMISLFAFIVTLGIVVDDAIVVGEAIHTKRQQGMSPSEAAIAGVREVAMPVVSAVLTTIFAFAPMLFVPGPAGKFFRLIPMVVIAVLLISLVESLLVLPAHLAHRGFGILVVTAAIAAALILGMPHGLGWAIVVGLASLAIGGVVLLAAQRLASGRAFRFVEHQQQRFSRLVEWMIGHTYVPVVRRALQRRYLTACIGAAILLGSIGLVAGGRLNFTFMPKVDSDVVVAGLEMPFGTSVSDTRGVGKRILTAAEQVMAELGGGAVVSRGIFSQVGDSGSMAGGPSAAVKAAGGSHLAEVAVFLVPLGERKVLVHGVCSALAREDRRRRGGAHPQIRLQYRSERGRGGGRGLGPPRRSRARGGVRAALGKARRVLGRLRHRQRVRVRKRTARSATQAQRSGAGPHGSRARAANSGGLLRQRGGPSTARPRRAEGVRTSAQERTLQRARHRAPDDPHAAGRRDPVDRGGRDRPRPRLHDRHAPRRQTGGPSDRRGRRRSDQRQQGGWRHS